MILQNIKEVISGVVYGSIDQKLHRWKKRTYGIAGLIIAVTAQVALAWLLGIGEVTKQVELAWWQIPDRALLNIIVSPFQLIGILSLIYIIQSVTNNKYPFRGDSIWHLRTEEEYVPFLIRARAFIYQPYVVLYIIGQYIQVYIDYTNKYPNFIFSLIGNNSIIFLAFVVSRLLKQFIDKFESAIKSVKDILPNELELKNYEKQVRESVFNRKEIVYILILFFLIKLIDVLSSDRTWRSGGNPTYDFPLTAILWGFYVYIISWLVITILGSLAYIHTRIDSALKILKDQKLNIFLFHQDGYAGLGGIRDFLFSFLTKILLIISVITFGVFLALQIGQIPFVWQIGVLMVLIVADSYALITFIYPLMEMRNIIKRKKEEERKLLFERIKKKEEAYLKGSLRSEEFQEIENYFNLIKRVDAVPEWGIESKQGLSLLGKFLLTFNGPVLQMLIKYLNINFF